MTEPETAALNPAAGKSVAQDDGTRTERQKEMRIQPGFVGRKQLFDRPTQYRQQRQENHHDVSPKDAPVNLGPLGGALKIFSEALGPHVLSLASGVGYAINIPKRSALPLRRTRGKPFPEQLSQGA